MEYRESIDIDIDVINRYLLMFKRRWLTGLMIFLATVAVSAVSSSFLKPTYEAKGKLLFRTPSFRILQGNEEGELRSLSRENPINNQIQLINSYDFLQEVVDALQLKNQKGEPLKGADVAKSLTLKIIPGTDVLGVTYIADNPKDAANVVNKIMELHLQKDIINNNSEAEATRQFLISRLPQYKSERNIAALSLRKFKQENNIVNIPEESKSIITTLAALNTEINNLNSQLADLTAQINKLEKILDLDVTQVVTVSNLSQSTAIQEILKNIQQVDLDLAKERGRFLEDNPEISNLRTKKANLEDILQQQIAKTSGNQKYLPSRLLQFGELKQKLMQNFLELELQRSGLIQKLESLQSSRSTYAARLNIMPNLEQKLQELEQNFLISQSTYETMVKKIQELQLAEKKNTANGRIVAKATIPLKAANSIKLLFLVLGVMFGIFFATTIVLFIEVQDQHLKTLQEIRTKLPYTLLGTIPIIGKKTKRKNLKLDSAYPDVIVINTPRSEISELYRMMQSNLKFISSDRLLKTIVITSAVPQEGKSTIAANLAATIAQLGRKVLLIDANMRVPIQQKIWNINLVPGLSDILLGEAKIEDAIATILPNLDLLVTGSKVPNPLALIDSSTMATIMNELHSLYDLIIIDSPPFLLTADALTLGQISDGMVLVCRPGVLDYNSASKAKEILQRSDKNILGMIVNGIIPDNEPNNYLLNNYYLMDEDVINNPMMKKLGKI